MGIRFLCPNGHRLNVKSFLAGKRGICPECDARFLVPLESGGQAEALGDVSTSSLSPAAQSSEPTAEVLAEGAASEDSQAAAWHVRFPAGQQHGPLSQEQVIAAIRRGEVGRDCWLWKTGWSDWQRASDVFPEAASKPGPLPPPELAHWASQQATTEEAVAQEPAFPEVQLPSVDSDVQHPVRNRRVKRARRLTWTLLAIVGLLSIVLGVILWQQL